MIDDGNHMRLAGWIALTPTLRTYTPCGHQHPDVPVCVCVPLQKGGVVMEVRMSRYNTRLRLRCWAEATLPNGRRVNGRCNMARGRSAHVVKLRWSGNNQE